MQETTYADAEIARNRASAAALLDAYQDQGIALVGMLQRFELDLADYPARLPSFDEIVHGLAGVSIAPPALSHDQLQAFSRIADEASNGGYAGGHCDSLAIRLRPDGLADVFVNGERQDFPMDGHGHPVNVAPENEILTGEVIG